MAQHSDWLALVERDGLVVSEPVLEQHFPAGPTPVAAGAHHWFRRKAERFRLTLADKAAAPERRADGARQWLDHLFEELLEHSSSAWKKAAEVPDACQVRLAEFDQTLRADRVLMGPKGPALLVSIVHPDQGLEKQDRREGRWKASPTTKLERLLRDTSHPLGLVTNGDVLRLMYAPPGFTAGHITWTSRLLTEEKATLDAFYTLLGRDLLCPTDDAAHSLADLCRTSIDRQGEVADQLGEQVRNGLERLIWSWDEADRAAHSELLAGMTEDGIYEMGLTIMMRLVFLLYAEERDLLPHGEVLYDQGYGLTYLWHQLQRQQREDPARLAETHDAWARFLATCRLVYGGCGHPDLSLIAYGGRLFDPRRFPVLEDPRCRVSNETFFHVLHLLLFARQRKGGEPQRVGYWAIDVEQIGYIYEGLLDHRCARAGDVPLVKLRGAGEAALPVTELEKRSRDEQVAFVAEETGRKPEAVREALANPTLGPRDNECIAKLPLGVEERVWPFAGIVQCEEVVPPGWRYLTTGTSRRASGAHYTPQSLTERIVRTTLEPLVYGNVGGKPGLLVEPRKVKSPRELLDLKVCDIAMGSGAFLVQVIRYLGARLVEAWDRALAAAIEKNPATKLSMPYADLLRDAEAERAIDPEHRDEMVVWARRYVAERCVYGVDKNPLAVEMAQLSLWLTTLAKDRPFTFLDHALRCGDSLVGVDREQLLSWSLDRKGVGSQLGTLEPLVGKAVDEALELRKELAQITVLEAADSERKAVLLDRANRALERVRLAGDCVVAPSFATEKAKEQAAQRDVLLARFAEAQDAKVTAELRSDADRMLVGQRTFHWPFEFPEVFLDGDRGGFDAIVGNPPYMGGTKVSAAYGRAWLSYLVSRWPEGGDRADLIAYFIRRGFENLRADGTLGVLATNSLAERQTSNASLRVLVDAGASLFSAISSAPWPGQAKVKVSVAHLSKGAWAAPRWLDGRIENDITPLLTTGQLPDALELVCPFVCGLGVKPNGPGFLLPMEEARQIARNARSQAVVRPYLRGDELNALVEETRVPTFAIYFGEMDIEEARTYPEAFRVLERIVLPERTQAQNPKLRTLWWQFGRHAKDLQAAIRAEGWYWVTPETGKYLVFLRMPSSILPSNLCVSVASSSFLIGGVLHSSLHEAWAHRPGVSKLRSDMRYNPGWAVRTMPWPLGASPAAVLAANRCNTMYDHRAQLMVANDEGLTATYNRFHDPEDKDTGIQKLRNLHVEMDLAVRDAYGWSDLELGHGWVETKTTEEKKDKKTGKVRSVTKSEWRFTISEKARQEVLRRLLALNHERYAEEVAAGLHDGKKGRQKVTEDDGAADAPEPAETELPKKRSVRAFALTHPEGDPQLGLFGAAVPGPAPAVGGKAEDGAVAEPKTTGVQSPPNSTAKPVSVLEAVRLSQDAAAVLTALDEMGDWRSKAEVAAALGIEARAWNAAISELLARGEVERQGQKRGTRYRAVGANTDDSPSGARP
ncbi:MAG: hypothetical protein HY905_15820 [Deltaproteobacteria bacterium]|nr:hypothetical protein [Deltaproteobacteria bacterium]